MWRSVAGPAVGRLDDTRGAHGWRSITRRAAIAWARIASFQSADGSGCSISATTASTRPVEQVVLVPDVTVEGHRLDPELLAELAHAQGLDAVAIGEVDGGPKHALLGQRRRRRRFGSGK